MGADGRLFAMLVTKMDEFVSSRYIGAGQAVHSGQLARSKSAEGCGSPAATSKGHRPFEAPTEPTGETSSLHWVLSGAKRRQIQQLRCCVLQRQAVETEIRKIIYSQIIYI